MDNTAEVLIQDIYQRGVILKVEGNDLRFKPQSRMTPELLGRLRNHKTEVISKLTTPVGVTETPKTIEKRTGFADRDCRIPPSDGISVLRPGHPLASFDHDSVFGNAQDAHPAVIGGPDTGTCPCCDSDRFWRSIYDDSLICAGCHPPVSVSVVAEWITQGEPARWADDVQKLVEWFLSHIGEIPTNGFQEEINVIGLKSRFERGPRPQDAIRAVGDLRILQCSPAEFHAEMVRRHERELNQWNPRYGREK